MTERRLPLAGKTHTLIQRQVANIRPDRLGSGLIPHATEKDLLDSG